MNCQLSNIINFLMYLGTAIPLVALGFYVFVRTTPYNDFAILRAGGDVENPQNIDAAMATAYDLGGKILGLTLVLVSAIIHSANIIDLIVWGMIGIAFEVIIFCLFRWVVPLKVTTEIPKGNVAVGILSAALSIASGLLMAALLSY